MALVYRFSVVRTELLLSVMLSVVLSSLPLSISAAPIFTWESEASSKLRGLLNDHKGKTLGEYFRLKLEKEEALCEAIESKWERTNITFSQLDDVMKLPGAGDYGDLDNVLHVLLVKFFGGVVLENPSVKESIASYMTRLESVEVVYEHLRDRILRHDFSKFVEKGPDYSMCNGDSVGIEACQAGYAIKFLALNDGIELVQGYRLISVLYATPRTDKNFLFAEGTESHRVIQKHLSKEDHHPLYWMKQANADDKLNDDALLTSVILEMLVDGWSRTLVEAIKVKEFPEFCKTDKAGQCGYCPDKPNLGSFSKIANLSLTRFQDSMKKAFESEEQGELANFFLEKLPQLSHRVSAALDGSVYFAGFLKALLKTPIR
ncbi:MAG: hypothetical protein ACPG5T_07895 [Endozoicomonas sp.]